MNDKTKEEIAKLAQKLPLFSLFSLIITVVGLFFLYKLIGETNGNFKNVLIVAAFLFVIFLIFHTMSLAIKYDYINDQFKKKKKKKRD
ncbi:hypothetical protein P7H41_13515 [Vagococcus fluvialis]|uniref:hypothetical protein n=1 Tax=Vagococcus fluvialis TaxID=2738 RepID=UPI0028922F2B|nr:hypothetical protein [Vagococcus fluvialis]MDT2782961.1 hypothetical protein [Vagococcus fluvialis]